MGIVYKGFLIVFIILILAVLFLPIMRVHGDGYDASGRRYGEHVVRSLAGIVYERHVTYPTTVVNQAR